MGLINLKVLLKLALGYKYGVVRFGIVVEIPEVVKKDVAFLSSDFFDIDLLFM